MSKFIFAHFTFVWSFAFWIHLRNFPFFIFDVRWNFGPEYFIEKFHGRFQWMEEDEIYFNTPTAPASFFWQKMEKFWLKLFAFSLGWNHRRAIAVAYRSVNSDQNCNQIWTHWKLLLCMNLTQLLGGFNFVNFPPKQIWNSIKLANFFTIKHRLFIHFNSLTNI